MIKSIKEKINRKNLNENAETLVALHTHTHTHTGDCLLENKIVNVNNAEILNCNKNFSKGRTMPILNIGIGLSLSAFWRRRRNKDKSTYLIMYKEVRAGP